MTSMSSFDWSSYLDHKKIIREENSILNLSDFPEYFSNIGDFDEEILDWINCSPHV